MRYNPLFSAAVGEHFSASHVEQPPTNNPGKATGVFSKGIALEVERQRRMSDVRYCSLTLLIQGPAFFAIVLPFHHLIFPICTGKQLLDLANVFIHAGQPPLAGLCVMVAVQPPLIDNAQVVLEVKQQLLIGHGPSREKVVRHPARLKVVGVRAVAKDVDKQLSLRLQPLGDAIHQLLVVLHVLKHFNAKSAVELACASGEVIDVSGDDGDVAQAPGRGLRINVLFLRRGIGHGSDLGIAVSFCNEQRGRTLQRKLSRRKRWEEGAGGESKGAKGDDAWLRQ